MAEMTGAESFERVTEGLKKSSSLLRDLARIQKNNKWFQAAKSIDGILQSAETIYKSKGQSRQEALTMADQINKDTADKQDTKH